MLTKQNQIKAERLEVRREEEDQIKQNLINEYLFNRRLKAINREKE